MFTYTYAYRDIIDGTRYAAICYLYDAARACSAWLSCRVETCSDEPLCTLSEHEWSELQAEIRLSSAALAAICTVPLGLGYIYLVARIITLII